MEIYRYVIEGSFDAYMWQTLETKARFIQQVMTGQTAVRSAEDLEGGALTYAEIKAIASGIPQSWRRSESTSKCASSTSFAPCISTSSTKSAGNSATCPAECQPRVLIKCAKEEAGCGGCPEK